MKYSVLVKPKVMIRIDGIEAESQKEAAIKAVEKFEDSAYDLMRRDLRNYNCNDSDGQFRYVEHADGEEEIEVLVDEAGDDKFERSKWYLVTGDTPDKVIEHTPELTNAIHAAIKAIKAELEKENASCIGK